MSPSSSDQAPHDEPNWSAGDGSPEYGGQLSSPPSGRAWDPGPAPTYETPGYQPLTEVVPAPPVYTPPVLPLGGAPTATNGLAIASLICGIAGYVVFPVIAPLLAIIFGHVARGQIRRTGEGGGGMAIAGLLLGYINLALAVVGAVVVIIIVLAIVAAASQSG